MRNRNGIGRNRGRIAALLVIAVMATLGAPAADITWNTADGISELLTSISDDQIFCGL